MNIKPKYLISFSVSLAIILVIINIIDINQGQEDIYKTKTDEAVSLLRAVQKAGENVFLSNEEVEKLISQKLVNSGYFISMIYPDRIPSDSELSRYSWTTGIDHIYFYSPEVSLLSKNSNKTYSHFDLPVEYKNEINSLQQGFYDYVVLKSLQDSKGQQHFAVLHKLKNRGFIVLSIESNQLLQFRIKIGIGKLFQKIASEGDIKYIVIQDGEGILTASSGVTEFSSISDDKFLIESLEKKKIATRELFYNKEDILEAVKPFRIGENISGIIRIGVSLESVNRLVNRTIIRSIVISIFLLLTGVIIFVFITHNQRFSILKEEYNRIQTYTGNILDNMSDGVVAVDSSGKINLFNKGAEKIFGINAEAILGKNCESLIIANESLIDKTIRENKSIDFYEHTITTKTGRQIIIGGTTSIIRRNDGTIDTVAAVIRDLTAQRNSEEMQKRQEKITAMGELAGSVAHEIKNPLNSIGITVQRFEKEFTPIQEKKEYYDLIKTMKSEINRVTNIINQFLNFAKPPKIHMYPVNVKEFIDEIYRTYKSQAIASGIDFNCTAEDLTWDFDPLQMKQVINNLLQNSFDAIKANGRIALESFQRKGNLTFVITDNGSGIKESDINKIFNLYFTTKPNGTGIGLSIVNQIIQEHNGTLKVESKLNEGTEFIIEIPFK